MAFGGVTDEIKALTAYTNASGDAFIFGGTCKGEIIRWNAAGIKLNSISGHPEHSTMCLSAIDDFIFSGGGDGLIKQHKHQGEHIKTFDYHSNEWIRSISVQGDVLISTSNDNNMAVLPSYSVEEPNPVICSGHTDWVSSHVFHNGVIFTASYDKTIRQWVSEDSGYTTSFTYIGHENLVTSVAIASGLLASSSRDETVKLWRIQHEDQPGQLVANIMFGGLLRYLVSDSRQLYVVTSDNTIVQLSTPDLAHVITTFVQQNTKAFQNAKKTLEESLATGIKKLQRKKDRKVSEKEKELRAAAAAAQKEAAAAQKAAEGAVEGEGGEEEETAEPDGDGDGDGGEEAAAAAELSEEDSAALNDFKEKQNCGLEAAIEKLRNESTTRINSLIHHTVYTVTPKELIEKPFIMPRISSSNPLTTACLLVTPTHRELLYSQQSTIHTTNSNLNTLTV
eukprot:TRINITY_DN20109_c0_g1_i1.p1 TRINITY_DN20109_c0_g1~~TRINITY_DN20109_c0_g1_i1.p1  ORF type:complete len:451 (+),score=101.88 TRINITY_DN20109_c0_g1_i1:50-1402(+)